MKKTIAAMAAAGALVLSMAGCDGSHDKVSASPEKLVATTETTGGTTTWRNVKVLSKSDDSASRTFAFKGERGRTSVAYKLADGAAVTILVIGPDDKVVDSLENTQGGDGSFSLDIPAAGDYSLKVSNPKQVRYTISVSQRIDG
ncbi:hypothetical protein ASE12_17570 [Aeromicrobium sp. Root236]|uniref:hypothetical protein n=1 Tax=Aeromicrobium sp. Root236 TaxID=1736498 RepID=UPI0006FEAAE8|nr:hypothetical protein [Aeromicrobium sp. Root236]KRC66413.1 hypothetical protein ASE12_17570 [Aeromicrobium sp. Root236]